LIEQTLLGWPFSNVKVTGKQVFECADLLYPLNRQRVLTATIFQSFY